MGSIQTSGDSDGCEWIQGDTRNISSIHARCNRRARTKCAGKAAQRGFLRAGPRPKDFASPDASLGRPESPLNAGFDHYLVPSPRGAVLSRVRGAADMRRASTSPEIFAKGDLGSPRPPAPYCLVHPVNTATLLPTTQPSKKIQASTIGDLTRRRAVQPDSAATAPAPPSNPSPLPTGTTGWSTCTPT